MIYRIGGNPLVPARLAVVAPDATVKFCRITHAEIRATTTLADPRNTFARVHVRSADSLVAEMALPAVPAPPIPTPPVPPSPLPPCMDDVVPTWYGYAYPYPAQTLIAFDAAASFGPNMRADINLMTTPNQMPPMGPTWYTYFPYVVTIYTTATITATLTVQFA